jgi:hypothetical protein
MDQTNSNAKTASSASSHRLQSVASWRQSHDAQSLSSDYAMEPSRTSSRHDSDHSLDASPCQHISRQSLASPSPQQQASPTPNTDLRGQEREGSRGTRASHEQRTSSHKMPQSAGNLTAVGVEEIRGAIDADRGSRGTDAARLICVDADGLSFLPSGDVGAVHGHFNDHVLLVRNVSTSVVALSYSCLEDDDLLGKVDEQSRPSLPWNSMPIFLCHMHIFCVCRVVVVVLFGARHLRSMPGRMHVCALVHADEHLDTRCLHNTSASVAPCWMLPQSLLQARRRHLPSPTRLMRPPTAKFTVVGRRGAACWW